MLEIPPPDNVPSTPDPATRKGLTGPDGTPNRVLYINLGIFRYGTDDKVHAGAIALSLILLLSIMVVVIWGMFTANLSWADKTFSWLGSAFLFTAGIALGSGTSKGNNED